MSNKLKGKAGEDIAVQYLKNNKYEILDRNFRFKRYGEIDIVAKKSNIISFIEVKYRTTKTFGMPLEAITKSKLEKIFLSAKYYLQSTNIKNKGFQIDAISIFDDNGEIKIEHIKNIEI